MADGQTDTAAPRGTLKGAFVSMSIFAASAVVGGVLAGLWLSYQRAPRDTDATARAVSDTPAVTAQPATSGATQAQPADPGAPARQPANTATPPQPPAKSAEQAAPPMPEAPALPPMAASKPAAPTPATPPPVASGGEDAGSGATGAGDSTAAETGRKNAAGGASVTAAPATAAPPASARDEDPGPLSLEMADALNDSGHVIARAQTRRMIAAARNHAGGTANAAPPVKTEVSPVTGAAIPPTPTPASPTAIAGKKGGGAPDKGAVTASAGHERALAPKVARELNDRGMKLAARPAPANDAALAPRVARALNARGVKLAARPAPATAHDTLKKLTDTVTEAINATRPKTPAQPQTPARPKTAINKPADPLKKLQDTVAEAINQGGITKPATAAGGKTGDSAGYVKQLVESPDTSSKDANTAPQAGPDKKKARPARDRFYVRNGKRYTRVRKGDTLAAIARAAYGTAAAVGRILAANKGRISVSALKPGTEIYLPKAGAGPKKAVKKNNRKPARPAGNRKTAATKARAPKRAPRRPRNSPAQAAGAKKTAAGEKNKKNNATTGLNALLRPPKPPAAEPPKPKVITNFGPRKPPDAQ